MSLILMPRSRRAQLSLPSRCAVLLKVPDAGDPGISIVLAMTRMQPGPRVFYGSSDVERMSLSRGAYS